MRASKSAASAAVGGPRTCRAPVDPPEDPEDPMDEVEELLLMEC